MATASRDSNSIPTLLGALSTDGITPVKVKADPNNHGLKISNGTTGSDFGRTVAARDENFVPVLLAVSEADGVTPVEVYADSDGNLLVDHT